jgi:hypothetical protein
MTEYIAYYQKNWGRFDELPDTMPVDDFLDGYAPVMFFMLSEQDLISNLDTIYYQMQGDKWSPHGEARELIKNSGLSHTSMSIGDIIYAKCNGNYYFVSGTGFQKVLLTN